MSSIFLDFFPHHIRCSGDHFPLNIGFSRDIPTYTMKPNKSNENNLKRQHSLDNVSVPKISLIHLSELYFRRADKSCNYGHRTQSSRHSTINFWKKSSFPKHFYIFSWENFLHQTSLFWVTLERIIVIFWDKNCFFAFSRMPKISVILRLI